MKRQLTLVRHAKSDWSDQGLKDFDRPLNRRGQRNAPDMAGRLAAEGLIPDLLLTSPALRALTTAQLLAAPLGIDAETIVSDRRLYNASPARILETLRGVDPRHLHVMLVGHNPGITECANALTDVGLDNLATCAVLSAEFELPDWAELQWHSGHAVFYDYPKSRKPGG